MKKLIIFSAIILLSMSAKADIEPTFQIKFTMETIDGKISSGYVSYCCIEMDFFKNAECLKEIFSQSWQFVHNDTLNYYQNRLPRYNALINRTNIPLKKIKTIKLDKIVEVGTDYIISKLQLQDSIWLKNDPIKRVAIPGIFCIWDIFIHINSEEVEQIIKQAKLKTEELNLCAHRQEEKIRDIETEIREILNQLNGHKVVVTAFCTC